MPAATPQTSPRRAWWIVPVSMLAAGTVAFLLYNRALDFAFFNDDPTGHFAWMEGRGYADYFRTSADYGYYRPVVFVVLQGLVDSVGYNARLFHALLLGLQAANVALLWLLSWRLSRSYAFAWATALIFTFSPFSYEAIAYVASLTHPLLLFWALLTLLLYQQARRLRADAPRLLRSALYTASLATLLLGLLTHENAIFIPLAMAGIEWLERRPRSLVDALRRPFLPYLLVTPLFLLLWWSIPKTSEQVLPSFSSWQSNVIPFLQTLVFPLLPLLNLSAAHVPALVVLAALTILITLLAARTARAIDLWLFGLAWFILSALPATLFLSPDYLYGSPRLHYLPSVGVAMLWAMPVLAVARTNRGLSWESAGIAAIGVLYVLAIIWPPTIFIQCELDFYEEVSRISKEMAAVGGQSAGDGRDLLFVNVPVFFSSYAEHPEGCENPYPWTPVGAVLLPDYAAVRDFVRFNGGPDRPAMAVTVDAYAPGWNTFGEAVTGSDLRARLAETAVFVFDLNAGRFFDLTAAWQVMDSAPAESRAVFGDQFQLVSADVTPPDAANNLAVLLKWRAEGAPGDRMTPAVFVHVYDQNGRLVAQHDGPPGGGLVPATWWESQDIVIDRFVVDLGDTVEPGIYEVGVGLYDPASAVRFEADVNGTPAADNVVIVAELTLP